MLNCMTNEASATSDEDDGFWELDRHEGGKEMNGESAERGRAILLLTIPHTDGDLRPRFQIGLCILTSGRDKYGRGGPFERV